MTPQIQPKTALFALLIVATGVLAGCSGQNVGLNVEEEIEMRDQRISELEQAAHAQQAELEQSRRAAESAAERARLAEIQANREIGNIDPETELLPMNASAGECYARVLIPPVYESTSERVMVKEASSSIEVVPAEYEWTEESVLVKEAGEKLVVVPATHKTVQEQVLVKGESTRMVEVPAVYETETEEILVTPAREYWKRGRGPVEKVDGATGEIMCLVKEPAVYKTVTKRVLKSEATTREETIPAEYKTITRTVIDQPAHTRTEIIPAAYETVKVRKLVNGPREIRTPIEAEYRTVTKTVMSEPSYMEWRQILCETNMTHGAVLEIQKALKSRNYNPGVLDGIYGKDTMAAVNKFQEDNGLARGQLTYETIDALGLQF